MFFFSGQIAYFFRICLLTDVDTEKKEDTTIVKDISNVPIFKSFQYKCSAYTSRIYLYDEVKPYCCIIYICDQIYIYFDEREDRF